MDVAISYILLASFVLCAGFRCVNFILDSLWVHTRMIIEAERKWTKRASEWERYDFKHFFREFSPSLSHVMSCAMRFQGPSKHRLRLRKLKYLFVWALQGAGLHQPSTEMLNCGRETLRSLPLTLAWNPKDFFTFHDYLRTLFLLEIMLRSNSFKFSYQSS